MNHAPKSNGPYIWYESSPKKRVVTSRQQSIKDHVLVQGDYTPDEVVGRLYHNCDTNRQGLRFKLDGYDITHLVGDYYYDDKGRMVMQMQCPCGGIHTLLYDQGKGGGKK